MQLVWSKWRFCTPERHCLHYILRRKDDNLKVNKGLECEAKGCKETGDLNERGKQQVENEEKKNELVKKDVCDRRK